MLGRERSGYKTSMYFLGGYFLVDRPIPVRAFKPLSQSTGPQLLGRGRGVGVLQTEDF